MRRMITAAVWLLLPVLTSGVHAANNELPLSLSPTEGVITHNFVSEETMKKDLLQMLADFSKYMTANVVEIADHNSAGERMLSFKGENTFGNNEQGVRHNADMGMICAFLVKYGKDKVTLPPEVSWEQLEDLAMRSLVYSYSTHKANRLFPNKDNRYWGSSEGQGQWESSLWALSVAYSAFFQWDRLTEAQKEYILRLLESECEYELHRTIPTGYKGDTKAEENGWEADVLAVTLGLFPEHEKAPQWFERLREFAINSYSHPSDAENRTVIDPEYDSKRVCDLYLGPNLYEDYTLQNHNLFHTSYQNVVMQELGEAALALKLFQTELHGKEKWKTNALMHNNQQVMDNVLNSLALADGELAMPNGNDWSLFLFDQITSYTTMACFLKDPAALLLENMAYKYIKARQKTTPDGSWLLRADVGARRMGVEGHRVMMTWLMHEVMPTASVAPLSWNDFSRKYGGTKFFPCQNIISSSTPDRFCTFSWSDGLKSYTGYLTSQNPDNNKIIVPYRAHNTGNFIGWYEVEGHGVNAVPASEPTWDIRDDSFVVNGVLNTNDSTLTNHFAIYSGSGNAVIYLDEVKANADVTVTGERGGLTAISVDEFTRPQRRLQYEGEYDGMISNGDTTVIIPGEWVNIDGEIGFVAPGNKGMAFGDRANNNSIMTARLYPYYDDTPIKYKSGETVGKRSVVYYTNVDAVATEELHRRTQRLDDKLPTGWNGMLAAEPEGGYQLLLSNFSGADTASLGAIRLKEGCPVFKEPTEITEDGSIAQFSSVHDKSVAMPVDIFIDGSGLKARVIDSEKVEVINPTERTVEAVVTILVQGRPVKSRMAIGGGEKTVLIAKDGEVVRSEKTK